MQNFYESWKKTASARKYFAEWISDPEGLLTGNGYCEGVYEIRFVNDSLALDFSGYIGQAGFKPTSPTYVAQDVYERILQHLKHWFGGGYLTYWTGLDPDEDKGWKIELHLLSEEKNHSDRLKKETELIALISVFIHGLGKERRAVRADWHFFIVLKRCSRIPNKRSAGYSV